MGKLQRWNIGFLALLLVMFASYAKADLITNGDFETTTSGAGQLGYNTNATGWSITGGYTFLYTSATQAQTGSPGQFGVVGLWGPSNGSANGLTNSPSGGNFIGSDADFLSAAISQTVTGLTPGSQYQLSFYWAAGQEVGFTGSTQAQWQVSLGSQTQSTAYASNASEGFSGWQYQTFTFTATSASEVLSFLANGSPALPPFALLDDVSLTPVTTATATPEPGSWLLLLSATTVPGFLYFRRARKNAKHGLKPTAE